MYLKDFIRELQRIEIQIDEEELEQISKLADSTGKVAIEIGVVIGD